MHETHLRSIDLNLLPVLDALLKFRSVSSAAQAVNLSQPATSRALARLRHMLGDPLLIRSSRGFVLTDRAEALRGPLALVLGEIGTLIADVSLDPTTEVRTVRIAMTDAQAVLLLPRLIARLSLEAPGLSIAVVPYGADIAQRMATGEVDLVFALASTPLPPGAVSVALASDELAVVMSRKHPRAGGSWAMSDYGKWPSVGVSLVGDGTSDLDTLLARDGVSRRFAAVTPSFVTALSIVGATDAVTTVSRALADRFADLFGLAVLDAPFRETELATTLVMARVRQGDRLLAWLAGVIADQPVPGIKL